MRIGAALRAWWLFAAIAGGSLGACTLEREGTLPDKAGAGAGAGPTTAAAGGNGGGTAEQGAGGTTSGGGAGGSGVCGDGSLDEPGGEACDDGNPSAGDGCSSDCQVEKGWACSQLPGGSECFRRQVLVASSSAVPLKIADNAYNYSKGGLDSMDCVSLEAASEGERTIFEVTLVAGIAHSRVGNLVLKVENPEGDVVTVFSRPGTSEKADDGGDMKVLDTSDPKGALANVSADRPLTFRDGASISAEDIGKGLDKNALVCADLKKACEFHPDPGAASPKEGFDELFGGAPAEGTWRVCVGDAVPENKEGVLHAVTLILDSK